MVKNLLANAGDARDAGLIPGWGRSLEEEMATHSSILAWRVPRTEAGRLQSVGSAESDLADHTVVSSNARQAHPGPHSSLPPGVGDTQALHGSPLLGVRSTQAPHGSPPLGVGGTRASGAHPCSLAGTHTRSC